MLNLYDTATGEVRPLAQREPGTVSIYLCGPTVYGPPHLGHGRLLMYDVLRRYLEWRGIKVRLVSNVTDIDDKIINRANDEHRDWHEIANKCEAVWFRAMEGIGVARPTDVPAELSRKPHAPESSRGFVSPHQGAYWLRGIFL